MGRNRAGEPNYTMAADTYGALAMAYRSLVATRLPPTGVPVGDRWPFCDTLSPRFSEAMEAVL